MTAYIAIAVYYCKEVCPISDSVPLSRTFDHNGGVLMIEDHDVTITVPELAVAKGEKVEIQAVASLVGPYKLPDDCDPVSVFVWIGADYVFKQPVKITIPHFASFFDYLDDLVVLTADEEVNMCILKMVNLCCKCMSLSMTIIESKVTTVIVILIIFVQSAWQDADHVYLNC